MREIIELHIQNGKHKDERLELYLKWVKRSLSNSGTQNMLKFASAQPKISISSSALDNKPMLLNFNNGTYDVID
jgi:hypothetical protein